MESAVYSEDIKNAVNLMADDLVVACVFEATYPPIAETELLIVPFFPDSWDLQDPARAMWVGSSHKFPLFLIEYLFSKLIDTLTNQPGERSGSSLGSCTQTIQAVRMYDHPKYANRLVLVDTPGFDNTEKSDMEILQMISDWLKQTYFSCLPLYFLSSFPHRPYLV